MKMTALEKYLVNRPARATRTSTVLDRALSRIDTTHVGEVLEIGCGTGTAAHHLAAERGFRVTAVDIDAGQIELARRRHPALPGLGFEVGDATALAYQDQSFDLVVAQNVFHHIPCWERALEEISRVLRPGGLLVWQDFTVQRVMRPLANPLRSRVGVYTLSEVRSRLAARGLHQRVHERATMGVVERHHLVLQKLSVEGTLPALA